MEINFIISSIIIILLIIMLLCYLNLNSISDLRTMYSYERINSFELKDLEVLDFLNKLIFETSRIK